MRSLYNDPSRKNLRRKLRAEQTEAETLLWNKLRSRRLNSMRFVRQYGVGRYVLDFFCPETRLAIELDGSQHMEKEHEDYDLRRTAYLNALDIKVIRFWNNQVMSDMESVLEAIVADSPC